MADFHRLSWLTTPALQMLVIAVFSGMMLISCKRNTVPPVVAPAGVLAPLLTDGTAAAGIDFFHDAGAEGGHTYPEILGPGLALLDADGDKDLDIYFVQGGRVPGTEYGTPAPNRLYFNNGDGTFRDVTAQSGAGDQHFGMGIAVADYDNDGDTDILVTNVGPLVMLRNNGLGTFTDVTAEVGLGGADLYGQGASFFDADHDGDLDLYVANYTQWYFGIDPECRSPQGTADYCNPSSYTGAADRLYRNDSGMFIDISESSGIAGQTTRSMGVLCFDADGDGFDDVYVANDGEPNLLWINLGDNRFEERGLLMGGSVNRDGLPQGSMGIACEDLDGDGDFDLFVTHWRQETNTFYRNDGHFFTDTTSELGLFQSSLGVTGFGVGFPDLDRDGSFDLYVANGGVAQNLEPAMDGRLYDELDRLLLRDSNGRFTDAGVRGGDATNMLAMSRGAAFGDINGDGRIDIVVSSNRGPARLLLNTSQDDNHWIGVSLRGTRASRDPFGALVSLLTPARPRIRQLQPQGSYVSSSEPVVRFGLGADSVARTVVVRWPGDPVPERFENLGIDRVHELVQDSGVKDGGS